MWTTYDDLLLAEKSLFFDHHRVPLREPVPVVKILKFPTSVTDMQVSEIRVPNSQYTCRFRDRRRGG